MDDWSLGNYGHLSVPPRSAYAGAAKHRNGSVVYQQAVHDYGEEGMTPEGWRAKLIATFWDEKRRAYKMVDLDLTGEVTELSMTMENDVRKIVYYRDVAGKRIRTELTVTRLSDVEYRTQGECRDLSKTWICYDSISKKREADSKK